jgi:hypothetical protein
MTKCVSASFLILSRDWCKYSFSTLGSRKQPVHLCGLKSVHTYIHTYIRTYMHYLFWRDTYKYNVYVYIYTYMHIFVNTYKYNVYVYIYIYMHIFVNTYNVIHPYVYMYMYMYIHIKAAGPHMHHHTCMFSINACTSTTHTMCVYIHTCMHTYIRKWRAPTYLKLVVS